MAHALKQKTSTKVSFDFISSPKTFGNIHPEGNITDFFWTCVTILNNYSKRKPFVMQNAKPGSECHIPIQLVSRNVPNIAKLFPQGYFFINDR